MGIVISIGLGILLAVVASIGLYFWDGEYALKKQYARHAAMRALAANELISEKGMRQYEREFIIVFHQFAKEFQFFSGRGATDAIRAFRHILESEEELVFSHRSVPKKILHAAQLRGLIDTEGRVCIPPSKSV